MKSINEYIVEYIDRKENEMINEAFKSSILQEIAKQLKERIKDQRKRDKEEREASKYNWSSVHIDTSGVFNKLFYYNNIDWSKIPDDAFTEYSKDDPEAQKLVKRMASNRSNSFSGIAILLNNNEEGPKYYGMFICSASHNAYYSFITDWSIKSAQFRPGDALELLTDKFLLLDYTDYQTNDIVRDRSSNKFGVANIDNTKDGRERYYKELLEANRNRYKQYLAKVKADREANDEYTDKVKEYVDKVFSLVAEMSKNPIKYAKYEYEIASLMEYVSDKKVYIAAPRGKGHYSGKQGLLNIFKEYVKAKLSMAKGDSYSYEHEEYERVKKLMDASFKVIDEKYTAIMDKIAA